MHYLVATDVVHTTAAACDYLEERLEAGDAVSVVTVPEDDGRDAGDALNVANARLMGTATVDVERLDDEDGNDTADTILAAATERDVDALVLGTHAGAPEAGPALGSTARTVVEAAAVPVVIVPSSP